MKIRQDRLGHLGVAGRDTGMAVNDAGVADHNAGVTGLEAGVADTDTPSSQGEDEGEASSLSHDQLYDRIHSVILRDKLYLNPSFDRQALVDYLHLTPRQVGRAFAQGSDYASITSFINECRLEHSCELLANTDTSIDEVATASGFSVRRTFSRLFKERYGLTPSEYREQQRQR